MRLWRTGAGKIFLALLILGAVATGSSTGLLIAFTKSLPPVETLEEYDPNVVTQIYAADDQLIAELYLERRIIVPISKVPQHLIEATVAVEDAAFHKHYGLNLKGIMRAVMKNLMAGSIKEGGSTITQQLARNMFLTPERNLPRKIKESLLAIQIERRYTKDEILEFYFNQIYYGSGAYGVEAAAQTYFGKSVDQLDLGEAALLAGLPKAPSYYSPLVNYERALRRMRHALNRMLEKGYITEEDVESVLAHPPKLKPDRERVKEAPYFVEHVRQYLEGKYGSTTTYQEGIKVYTTLDLRMQRIAEKAVRRGLIEVEKRRGFRPPPREFDWEQYQENGIEPIPPKEGDYLYGKILSVGADHLAVEVGGFQGRVGPAGLQWANIPRLRDVFKPGDPVFVKVEGVHGEGEGGPRYDLTLEQEPEVEGALLALDPASGAIRAMVGGYDFRRSKFNRAVQAMRQPGSAFKTVVVAAALEEGYTPSNIFFDEPFEYEDPWTHQIWKPSNFDGKFEGPVTMRRILEDSRNVPAVRLVKEMGPEKVIEHARRMGISSPLKPYLSLALGSFDVTLLELTSAYATLANQGLRTVPHAIRYVTDKNGKMLEESFVESYDALTPQTSYVLTNLLKGVIEEGTGKKAISLGFPLAGKTGTTDEYNDAWFVGYAADILAGVWVGLDDHTPIGKRETGAKAALPIWMEFMGEGHEGKKPSDFEPPPGIVVRKIDRKTGLLATDNCENVIYETFVEGREPTHFCDMEMSTYSLHNGDMKEPVKTSR